MKRQANIMTKLRSGMVAIREKIRAPLGPEIPEVDPTSLNPKPSIGPGPRAASPSGAPARPESQRSAPSEGGSNPVPSDPRQC